LSASNKRTVVGYLIMIAATVGVFMLLRSHGETLVAPAGSSGFGATEAGGQTEALMHVLLAMLVVILAARVLGAVFQKIHQPPVIGEIVAGIMLGPSLLGRLAPQVSAYLLPKAVAPYLGVLSQIGVILYMFLVGLELDASLLRKRGHATVAISHASIIAPFLLGGSLALYLYPRLSSSDVPFTCFALFVGVSMSVTAFPVLARILTDRKVHKTRIGVLALACAAVDDVTAWCLLALVVSVVQARAAGALVTFGLTIAFIAVMILLVRPAMKRLAHVRGQKGRLTPSIAAAVFVAMLLSALATEFIGIHAIFGAFALGAVIPHDSELAVDLTEKLEEIVIVLLLPAFFAFTGMKTQIGLVSGADSWKLVAIIIGIASLGKFGGSFVASKLTGLGWRDSAALGILMNTRGLMELIVLNIGLELKVISPQLFAMLVIMAVTTTFITTPVLHLLTRKQRGLADSSQQVKPVPEVRKGVLVTLSHAEDVEPLVNLALALTSADDPPPRALTLVASRIDGVRAGIGGLAAKTAPRSEVLARALEHARSVGGAMVGNAMWTQDAGADVLWAADDAHASWILLGFHRPVFGRDAKGGMVKAVLDKSAGRAPHIGIVIHQHNRNLDRIFAVVDDSRDGRAALDLACRLGRRKDSNLQIIVVPKEGTEPEAPLAAMLKEAGRRAGRWLHTDVLEKRDNFHLAFKTTGDMVIIGSSLADKLGLPLDNAPGDGRCVVVVQGGMQPTFGSSQPSAVSVQQSASG
jgi:Kef-type K+ transport system membrane component KefB